MNIDYLPLYRYPLTPLVNQVFNLVQLISIYLVRLYENMATPQEIAEKQAREWLLAKPRAIVGFTAVASQLADRAIAKQADLLTNFAAAVNSGKWAAQLGKYAGNSLMADAYTEKMNSIEGITEFAKTKSANSISVKRHLSTILPNVLVLFTNAASGEITIPTASSEVGNRALIMSGLDSFEKTFSTTTTPAEAYTSVSPYMASQFGWIAKP